MVSGELIKHVNPVIIVSIVFGVNDSIRIPVGPKDEVVYLD